MNRFAWPFLLVVLCAAPLGAQESSEALFENAIRSAAEAAAPSIVTINTVGGMETARVRSSQGEGQLLLGVGPTAGVIVSEDGYIVSSVFNFLSKPEAILVTLANGKRAAAKIVAQDHARMLVLLKIDAGEPLIPAKLARKEELQIGQTAIAIGAAPGKSGRKISTGILSATGRIFGRALQTDARVSPANYGGPLVDLEGRTMGVVVPLSPTSSSEIAGLEWYDTGVSFAIPLEDVFDRLETLKQGKDIFAGQMGVGIKAEDRYVDPPQISAVTPNSPAAKAGIKVKDIVLAVDGKAVANFANFQDAMGAFDAGATPKLKLKRGDQEIEIAVTLVDKLPPYQNAALGLWLDRSATAPTVRDLLLGGAAEAARLRAKDVIVSVGGEATASRAKLLERLAALAPGEKTPVEINRGGQKQTLEVELGALSGIEQLPALGAAPREIPKEAKAIEKTGKQTLSLAEERTTGDLFIPSVPPPTEGFGLLVHLGAPASMNAEKMEATWKEAATGAGTIVLSPRPADTSKWLPSEVPAVLKLVETALASYPIDRERVAIVAEREGVTLALACSRKADMIHGVALVDAEMPEDWRPLPSGPSIRQSFLFLTRDPGKAGEQSKKLRAAGYGAFVPALPVRGEKATPVAAGELFRWLEMLDLL